MEPAPFRFYFQPPTKKLVERDQVDLPPLEQVEPAESVAASHTSDERAVSTNMHQDVDLGENLRNTRRAEKRSYEEKLQIPEKKIRKTRHNPPKAPPKAKIDKLQEYEHARPKSPCFPFYNKKAANLYNDVKTLGKLESLKKMYCHLKKKKNE